MTWMTLSLATLAVAAMALPTLADDTAPPTNDPVTPIQAAQQPVTEAPTRYKGPLRETLTIAHKVTEGDLPPIAERVPVEPLVVDLKAKGRKPGLHGGTFRTFVTGPKDVKYMSVWGYARLVGYNEAYELVPDLLKDVQISDEGRTVTLVLRRGHKWSDGHPFTTEDLRYWWEDVATNTEIFEKGPPREMLVGGEPPEVTVIDEVTISYSWPAPNPRFLPILAKASPLYIYLPAHYMKKYHAKYADPAKLKKRIGDKKWDGVHIKKSKQYKFDNPKLPVLQPWVNTMKKNSQRYVLVRNPFYHRIDTDGRQLPYIDTVELEIAAGGLIPLKASRGEATLQMRSLGFSDAPVLKKASERHAFVTRLWRSGTANEVALYPNLNVNDPVWRALFRDVRVRRALSLGISRKAINKVLYFGLAAPRGVSALEESPLYDEANATAWTEFNLAAANKLLDEAGLVERTPSGIRRLADGRPMEIVIETAGERREVEDALAIIETTWRELGIRLMVKPQSRDVMRQRAYAGYAMMLAWSGWNIGVPTPQTAPTDLAPVDQAGYSWPKWGQFYQTKGKAGEAPDLPEAKQLLSLFEDWTRAVNDEEKAQIWRQMLKINAEQVYAIGTVARAPVPMVHDKALMNVPEDALYAWDPGGQLGVHRPDEFFFEGGRLQ